MSEKHDKARGMRLRVELHGPGKMPRVTKAETGESLGVTAIKIEWDVKTGVSLLTLSTHRFDADVIHELPYEQPTDKDLFS